MPIIDNRVPLWTEHACAYLGHTGPCMACEVGAQATAPSVRQVHTDAGQGPCPHPHCVANGLGGNASPGNPMFRPVHVVGVIHAHCVHWPAGATDHACMKCNPGEIDRLNNLGAATSVGRYDEAPTMGVLNLGTASGGRIEMGSIHMPEKSFTRAEVLAVLKSRKAILAERPHFTEAIRELGALISIFERMD